MTTRRAIAMTDTDHPDPTRIARELVAEMLRVEPSPTGVVVLSTIDLELAGPDAISAVISSPQLRQAYEADGEAGVRALLGRAGTSPPSAWWCDEPRACEQILGAIYRRLVASPRAHDAYEIGTLGGIVWINLWLD